MARIRTIKPEFWTDDLMGSISRSSRLLFIASWNMADDEGLLRWSAPFLKGAVFPFDDDLDVDGVQVLMGELETAGVIFAYRGGRSQQALAYVVNFHKHQKINRPSPSRLPPPPVTDLRVKAMYAARDEGVCYLCAQAFDEKWSQQYENDFLASPDHLKPQAQGGTDYPSNIRSAHLTCNKGRRDRTPDQYREALRSGKCAAQLRHPDRFTNFSLPDSVSDSQPERERDQDHGSGSLEQELGSQKDNSTAAKPGADKRGTRLKDDWQLTPELRIFASDLGLEPNGLRDEFLDYWTSVPGSKGLKLDWNKTFKNRCRELGKKPLFGRGETTADRREREVQEAIERSKQQ